MEKRSYVLRSVLVERLNQAAELEHGLCLQYLYAGFALKSRVDEGLTEIQLEYVRDWKRGLYRVAREEMLHLGLVCNLLAAIGYPANFGRPNFPLAADFYPMGVEASLDPFSRATIERFIAFEAPKPPATARDRADKRSIGELYDEIADLFRASDSSALFVGDPAHQVNERQITDPTKEFDDEVRTGYGVEPFIIEDTKGALHAIDLIVKQGEGASEENKDTHYNTFKTMLSEYLAQSAEASAAGRVFAPARSVVSNPMCERRPGVASSSIITHPATLEVAELFNLSYNVMLLMMMRFYGRLDDTHEELFRLQQIVFFPLMTMVIRPVGELLSELPAFADGSGVMAGATFELPRALSLLPHKKAAYAIFREALGSMAARASSLQYLSPEHAIPPIPPAVRERLQFISENITRLAFNFDDVLIENH